MTHNKGRYRSLNCIIANTSKAIFSTMLAFSLFSCGENSKTEIEDLENKVTALEKELDEKNKALEKKVADLEGKAPAAITAAQFTAMQNGLGLKPDGTLDDTKLGGLSKVVGDLRIFSSTLQASVGLNADGTLNNAAGLAQTVAEIPDKIVKGVNAFADKAGVQNKKITTAEL